MVCRLAGLNDDFLGLCDSLLGLLPCSSRDLDECGAKQQPSEGTLVTVLVRARAELIVSGERANPVIRERVHVGEERARPHYRENVVHRLLEFEGTLANSGGRRAAEQELAFGLDRQSLTQDLKFAHLFRKRRGSPGV